MSIAIQSKPTAGERPDWLPTTVFPFQSRFLTIDGKRIHYLDEGSGPALLLVSAGQWSFMFRDIILRLRGTFRTVTLDFPGSGLSPAVDGYDQSVRANARVLEAFIDALDLQDITLLVHDVGGPIGFLVASRQPERFRALVITNTFGWPLADYPAVRRTLKIIGSSAAGAINQLTNLIPRFSATPYGVGRHMSQADRRAYLGPWRDPADRRATQQVLGHVAKIDPLMADIEVALQSKLNHLPVLTLFGRKNDRYGWQGRFNRLFTNVTAAAIEGGNHFPFNDDPEAFSRAITDWWTAKVSSIR